MAILLILLTFAFFFFLVIGIRAFFVMLLWNFMMPDLFHLPELGFMSAFGLTLLASLLVGSAGGVEYNKSE